MNWDNSWSGDLKSLEQHYKDHAEIEHLQEKLETTLSDGRNKLVQEISLLNSQLANCHKEIKRLREALLATAGTPEPSQLIEVNIRRMEALADSALDSTYEKECQAQMRLAVNLLREAYALPRPQSETPHD